MVRRIISLPRYGSEETMPDGIARFTVASPTMKYRRGYGCTRAYVLAS